jgi:DNA repair ATPase RecN
MTAEERRLEKIEERLTDVRLVLSALEWQLKDLIIWKQVAEIQLTEIVKAEEIADAISKRIHRTNTIRFTFVQKTLGSLVGVAALSDFILRLSGKG